MATELNQIFLAPKLNGGLDQLNTIEYLLLITIENSDCFKRGVVAAKEITETGGQSKVLFVISSPR